MMKRCNAPLLLLLLLVFGSCEDFITERTETNRVDGNYFSQEGSVYLFQDNCFYSDKYESALGGNDLDMVEMSCLIAEPETVGQSRCILYMGIPKIACNEEAGVLSFSKRTAITITFLQRLSSHSYMVHSKHDASARITGSLLLSEPFTGSLTIKATLDDGNRITLTFHHVETRSVFGK